MESKEKETVRLLPVKAYIDTNVIISYIWSTFFSNQTDKNSSAYKLINKGAMGEYEIFISFYTILEIHQHFTDYYLQQNAIQDGFGFREFSKVKKNYDLKSDQLEIVNSLIENLRSNEYLNYVDPEAMTDKFFKIIMKYVEGYLDFLDAIHLRTAIDTKCNYFVTRDTELRKRFQKLVSSGIINEPIKITSEKGFLGILKIKENRKAVSLKNS
jgi:predicted nucleic acid-binding protein